MTNPYVLFAIAALVALPVFILELDDSTNAILALGCLAFAYGGFEALIHRREKSYNKME